MLDEREAMQHRWEHKCDHDEARKKDRVAALRSMQKPRSQRAPKPAVSPEMEALKALVVALEGELREMRSARAASVASRLDAFAQELGVDSTTTRPRRTLSPGLLDRMIAQDDGE